MPAFDSLDFEDKILDVFLSEPYDGEKYSPNIFLVQNLAYQAFLLDSEPTGKGGSSSFCLGSLDHLTSPSQIPIQSPR